MNLIVLFSKRWNIGGGEPCAGYRKLDGVRIDIFGRRFM